jgi:HSP20 family protein
MITPNTSTGPTRPGNGSAEHVQQRPALAPAVDVFENENDVLVFADLPGVSKDDVTVRLEDGQLFFEARRPGKAPGSPLATEYRFCDYRRTFVVPQSVDASKIEAELKSGVLRIRLPKADSLKPRRIDIKAG